MDLLKAKAKAKIESMKTGKTVYLVNDPKTGETELSNAPLRGTILAYKNGKPAPIAPPKTGKSADLDELFDQEPANAKKTKVKKVATVEDESPLFDQDEEDKPKDVVQGNPRTKFKPGEMSPRSKFYTKRTVLVVPGDKDVELKPKKSMKEKYMISEKRKVAATKKGTPTKKAKKVEVLKKLNKAASSNGKAKPKPHSALSHKRNYDLGTISAGSIKDGVKKVLAEGASKAVLSVRGKVYGVSNAASWRVYEDRVKKGVDGIVIIVQGNKGYYVYSKADIKELLGDALKSAYYKEHGYYPKTRVPASHEGHFGAL